MSYGATREEWGHFDTVLGLGSDLLPVVSDPTITISPLSKMKALGKTPSRLNKEGHAVGFPEWTSHVASNVDLARWSRVGAYGISVITRRVRALDIDVADPVKAQEIEDMAVMLAGAMPARERENSGKRLMAFVLEGDHGKRVLKVDGGIVEFLGTGQQFIACGTHPSGARYDWRGGLPDALPVLSEDQFNDLWSSLEAMFATEPGTEGKAFVQRNVTKGIRYDDSVSDYLRKSVLFRGDDTDGRVYFQCPWESGHSGKSGDTETVYFPRGSNGFDRGSFKCMHASCARRTDGDFLLATGSGASGFEVLPPSPPAVYSRAVNDPVGADAGVNGFHHPDVSASDLASNIIVLKDKLPLPVPTAPGAMPTDLQRNGTTGQIKPILGNVVKVLERTDLMGFEIVYDSFRNVDMVGSNADGWQRVTDKLLIKIRYRLEGMNFMPVTPEMMRHGVVHVGDGNQIDSAQIWLNGWTWDKENRAEMFFITYLGCEDTPYARALGRYLWTALAGRVLRPGVQVDVVPILVGRGGKRKSTLVQSLAPSDDMFMEISLGENDADLSRKMQGKVVGEIAELRGLHTKEMEAIKAWVTRRVEKHIAKYQEHETTFARRLVCIGTTDKEEFLADHNNRRWAPIRIGKIDIKAIVRDRNQLWAEGAAMFRGEVAGVTAGVQWEALEGLMGHEQEQFKMADSWTELIADWWVTRDPMQLCAPADGDGFTTAEVFKGALRMDAGKFRRPDEYRMAALLREMGYKSVVRRVEKRNKRVWVFDPK